MPQASNARRHNEHNLTQRTEPARTACTLHGFGRNYHVWVQGLVWERARMPHTVHTNTRLQAVCRMLNSASLFTSQAKNVHTFSGAGRVSRHDDRWTLSGNGFCPLFSAFRVNESQTLNDITLRLFPLNGTILNAACKRVLGRHDAN